MKAKILDVIGYILFLLFMLVISPLLFVRGGILTIGRFYLWIRAKVYNQKPKTYYW